MAIRRSVQAMGLGSGGKRPILGRLGALLLLLVSAFLLWLSLAGLGLFQGSVLAGGQAMHGLVEHFRSGLSATALVVTAAVCSIGVLAAIIMVVRAGRRGSGPRRHVLVADEYGFVLVDTPGVEAIACAAALRAPGVVEADVEAVGAGASPVRLSALVGVHPGASIEEAGRSVRTLVRCAVEELVGLRVSDVVVSVHVMDPEELGRLLR